MHLVKTVIELLFNVKLELSIQYPPLTRFNLHILFQQTL